MRRCINIELQFIECALDDPCDLCTLADCLHVPILHDLISSYHTPLNPLFNSWSFFHHCVLGNLFWAPVGQGICYYNVWSLCQHGFQASHFSRRLATKHSYNCWQPGIRTSSHSLAHAALNQRVPPTLSPYSLTHWAQETISLSLSHTHRETDYKPPALLNWFTNG